MKFNCKNCLIEFNKKDHRSIFCSHSCSAIWNNKKRSNSNLKCINCSDIVGKCSSKYCSHKCQHDYIRNEKIKNCTASIRTIKKYLIDIDNSCKLCGLQAFWNENPLMLIIDHINGNSEDNSLLNLRLVCPNCDSQLPTFKSRNKGNGRHSRRERYSDGKSY